MNEKEYSQLKLLHRIMLDKHITVEELVRRCYFYNERFLNIEKLTEILVEIKGLEIRPIIIDYCLDVMSGSVNELKPTKLLGDGK